MNVLHKNHFSLALGLFKQVVTKKEYQKILDVCGPWVFRSGAKVLIKSKKIGPDRYEIWLATETTL